MVDGSPVYRAKLEKRLVDGSPVCRIKLEEPIVHLNFVGGLKSFMVTLLFFDKMICVYTGTCSRSMNG